MGNGNTPKSSPSLILVASTPGDSFMKSVLDIPQATKIDFIRWRLVLEPGNPDSFSLSISYGEARPNTMGFMDDDGNKSFSGTYTVTGSGTRYAFNSPAFTQPLSAFRLNENIFHLLGPGNKLINGNGGWSYTLNREKTVPASTRISKSFDDPALFKDTATQVTFDGRTPCTIAQDYGYPAGDACFKLKWRMILQRDPASKQSGTYRINRTLSRTQEIRGRWVLRPHPWNPALMMLQLDPDLPEKSIAFLIADDDVLFFLKKDYSLYTGNKDFSYTLNRKTW
jgi:hypothetical protein